MEKKKLDQELLECLQQCRARAMKDKEFRSLLLSDFRAAVKEETGKEFPENFKLQVVDLNKMVVSPCSEGELTEQEMEHISGGFGNYNPGGYGMSNVYDPTLPPIIFIF